MKNVKVILDRHDGSGQFIKRSNMKAKREDLGKTILACLTLAQAKEGDQIVVKFEVPE